MVLSKDHYLLQDIEADDDWVECVKYAMEKNDLKAIDVARAIDDEGFDWDEDPFDDLLVDLARSAVKKGTLDDVMYFFDEKNCMERWSDCFVCESLDNPDHEVAVYISRKLPLHTLRKPRPCAMKTCAEGTTFVHEAARHGNTAFIQKLVEEDGCCPLTMTRYGTTPIVLAVEKGHLAAVELLYGMMLKQGWTDIDIQRKSETNPPMPLLAIAMINDRHDVVRFLLSKNLLDKSLYWTSPKCLRSLKISGFTLPQLACALGNQECLQWYVEDCGEMDFFSKKQGSLLHFACRRVEGSSDDKLSVVQYLVDMGVSVTAVDGACRTPLDIARMFHLNDVVKLFEEMDETRIDTATNNLLEMELSSTKPTQPKNKKKKKKKKKTPPATIAAPPAAENSPSFSEDDDDGDERAPTDNDECSQEKRPKNESPMELCCPITLHLFEDPVSAPDGQTYERQAIEQWIDKKGTSPITGLPLQKSMLVPCLLVKRIVQDFRKGGIFLE